MSGCSYLETNCDAVSHVRLPRLASQKCFGRCTPTVSLRDLSHLRFANVPRVGYVQDCTSVLLGTGAFNRAFIMPSNDNGVLVAAPSNMTIAICDRGTVVPHTPSPLEIYVDIQSDDPVFSWGR